MTNSNNSSNLPPMAPKWSVFVALAAALAGFADALYLTVSHYRQAIPPCSIGGCETVLTSRFATIAGVPISLIGVIGYVTLTILLLLAIDKRSVRLLRWVRALATLSFAVSVVLVIVQVFTLHAICLYCMGSAITSTILFLSSLKFPNHTT
jgi:uncharacterized membrane protein